MATGVGETAPARSSPRRSGSGSGDAAVLILLVVFLAGIVALGMIPHVSPLLQLGLAGLLVVLVVFVPLLHRLRAGGDVSLFLLVPTVMSATQNVYLLPVAHAIGKGELQVFIVLNFLIALFVALGLWSYGAQAREARNLPEVRLTAQLLVAVSVWGFLTVGLFHTVPTAAFASYRNFVTPFLFLLTGLLASHTSQVVTYARYLVRLGLVVVVFGFYERFSSFWLSVPLKTLWEKKNLPISIGTGLPPNYYSSETLGGEQLRRMVSSFADPVNLGTFLFVVFVAAWLVRDRVMMGLSVVASGLAISKAALLGFLMFAFFRTRYLQAPTAAFLAACVAAVLGLGFYGFSQGNSTGSTSAHIAGLTSALSALPSHPLGQGMGGTGVLAGLFSTENSTVSAESGLGVIIGQLGAPGLLIFAVLVVMLTKRCLALRDRRDRVAAMTLLVGFGLNAAFNEVALSPNSAAPYFVILGLLLGAQARADRRAAVEPDGSVTGSVPSSSTRPRP